MRYLCLDLGDKRTGLAVGDDETRSCGPVGLIEASDPAQLLRGVRDAIDEHAPGALVIGVPLHMDGSESAQSHKARALGLLLAEHTRLAVHYHDERLTSFEADLQMSESGLTRKQKKKRRDMLAAAAILRSFLASGPPDASQE